MVEDAVSTQISLSHPQQLTQQQSPKYIKGIMLHDTIAIEQHHIKQKINTNQSQDKIQKEKDIDTWITNTNQLEKQYIRTKTEKEPETQQKMIETESRTEQQKHQKKRKITKESKNIEKSETDNINEETLNPAQSKYPVSFCGCMRPDASISHHPAFQLLMRYATEGCPVDCGKSFGPHILARSPEAVNALQEEAMEKVNQGYVEVLRWDDIKQAPHKHLKISPIVAVPHKSRQIVLGDSRFIVSIVPERDQVTECKC